MTTFPTPNPMPYPAEHPRDTSHIGATAKPSYPAGPVPIDPKPAVEKHVVPGTPTGAPGLPAMPTAENTRAGA